uniref:Lipoprotein n=1 Tax=Siphoviridae sp. ctYaH2 TaxID=2825549 RepID=A0A8S5V5L3_9CAUD|nr:MAG TPA: lipoprotein [Siphoviridae sp. ctYaH2]
MRKLLTLLLAFLSLVGCRTKKVETYTQRQVQKEHFITNKDSSQLFVQESHKSEWSDLSATSFELELENDKDSLGNAKELTFTRTRDGNSETIRVRNGKVKIKAISSHSKRQQQAGTTFYEQSYTNTKTEVRKHEIQQAEQIQKHTQSTPLRNIFWLLLLVVLAYVYWRYKRFKQKI